MVQIDSTATSVAGDTPDGTQTASSAARPKARALGRGLESLLPARSPAPPAHQSDPASPASAPTPIAVREIPVNLIDDNPLQPRSSMDPAALAELTRSIHDRGLLQPIVVRARGARYLLIGGQRRLLAVREIGHTTILAHVIVASDEQAFELAIIENLQREDLTPMEQAQAFGRLASEFGFHHDQIAAKTSKSRSAVTNYLRLLRLPHALQDALNDGRITMGHAKALLSLNDPESMSAIGFRVIAGELSVRKTEELVQVTLHGRPKKEVQPPPPRDPNVRQAEEELQRVLGLRVAVEDRGGRGRVVIEYSSLDDFERLVGILDRRQ